jgi:hypothetical protein
LIWQRLEHHAKKWTPLFEKHDAKNKELAGAAF